MARNSKSISAGFIIRSKNNKYLFGRATYDREDSFTVFKGRVEKGETLIDAAMRELKEETGIDIAKDEKLCRNISTNPIFDYSIKSKDVYLFLLNDKHGVLDGFNFNCSSYTKSGEPEILDYKWLDLEEAYDKVFPSQKGLINFLKKM